MNEKEITENKKKKNNKKKLYICKSVMDEEEYKKLYKNFPRYYWVFIIFSTILNLIIVSIISLIFKNITLSLFIFVINQLFLMIWFSVRLEKIAEKSLRNQIKNDKVETEFITEFYEDYFVRKSKTVTMTIKYIDIEKCIETDTNFYLEYTKGNKIIFLQKNNCSLELISFIREKFEDIENRIGEGKFKKNGIRHNPKFIKNSMIVLFILVILSIWFALYTWDFIDKIIPQHGFNHTKNTWVFWLWLPIPIISIILGIKYNKVGFKTTKNIVAGFIVTFLLLIYGSFSLLPSYTVEYDEINNYKSFLNIDIPNEGELQIQDWNAYSEDDKKDFTVIEAYYDNIDTNKIENSIEKSDKWINNTDIKSELKIYIPTIVLSFYSNDNVYYSFYNQTLDEYNKVPNSSGEYQIYTMKYYKEKKQLSIYKYKLIYK